MVPREEGELTYGISSPKARTMGAGGFFPPTTGSCLGSPQPHSGEPQAGEPFLKP